MEYQLDFTVTKDLVKTATRRFWLQFVGWGGLLRWTIMPVVLIVLSVLGRRDWLYALIVFATISVPLIWVLGFFNFLRRAFYRYDQMQSKLVSYRFTEQGMETKSDLGSADIPWRMLEKVQCYPDVWLLFFGRRDYAYIPATKMTEPLKNFVLQQAGNKSK